MALEHLEGYTSGVTQCTLVVEISTVFQVTKPLSVNKSPTESAERSYSTSDRYYEVMGPPQFIVGIIILVVN